MALSTISGVGAGSSGTILTTGAPQSGGVIQVVNALTTTTVTSATNTFVSTTLTATITPKFATSKILVLVNQNGLAKTNNTSCYVQLLRNATVLAPICINGGYTASTASNYLTTASISYLDSPSTTSATTYLTQISSRSNISGVSVQDANETSTITLMEIAA